jgi:hypothetical protein
MMPFSLSKLSDEVELMIVNLLDPVSFLALTSTSRELHHYRTKNNNVTVALLQEDLDHWKASRDAPPLPMPR